MVSVGGFLGVLLAAASAMTAGAATFVPGAICENDNRTDISLTLRDKHLQVGMLNYPPYALKDSTKTGNDQWSGFDVDLLKKIATAAGFTYTLHEIVLDSAAGESYFDLALRTSAQLDLITSWWSHTMQNRENMIQLTGHIDASVVLITKGPAQEEQEFTSLILSFLTPFKTEVWLVLVFVVIPINTLVMGYLEFGRDDFFTQKTWCATIMKSGYLSFAAFAKRGSHNPRSTLGRAMFLMWGFLLLIVYSAYTASLASFLTVGAVYKQDVTSLEDLMAKKYTACYDGSTEFVTNYTRQHPAYLASSNKDIFQVNDCKGYCPSTWKDKLMSEQCKAVLMPKADWEYQASKKENCVIQMVGGVVNIRGAGWLTNKQSSCVSQSIDYFMQVQIGEGTVSRYLKRYIPHQSCIAETAADSEVTPLGLKELGGLILCFGVGMALMICVRVSRYFMDGEYQTKSMEAPKESADEKQKADTDLLLEEYNQVLSTLGVKPPVQPLGALGAEPTGVPLLTLQAPAPQPGSPAGSSDALPWKDGADEPSCGLEPQPQPELLLPGSNEQITTMMAEIGALTQLAKKQEQVLKELVATKS